MSWVKITGAIGGGQRQFMSLIQGPQGVDLGACIQDHPIHLYVCIAMLDAELSIYLSNVDRIQAGYHIIRPHKMSTP